MFSVAFRMLRNATCDTAARLWPKRSEAVAKKLHITSAKKLHITHAKNTHPRHAKCLWLAKCESMQNATCDRANGLSRLTGQPGNSRQPGEAGPDFGLYLDTNGLPEALDWTIRIVSSRSVFFSKSRNRSSLASRKTNQKRIKCLCISQT